MEHVTMGYGIHMLVQNDERKSVKTQLGGSQYIENKVARIICNNVEAVPHRKYRFFKVGT